MRTVPTDRVDAFIELAWTLNRHHPWWVPPLRAQLQRELVGWKLFQCGDAGKIAAFIDPRLPVGQIGFFECVDDPAVAQSLFEAACRWLRDQGIREVWGPMNGGAHRLHRLMTRGFERPPFLFEPRNPPHYPRLFEANGFRTISTWSSLEPSRAQIEQMARRFRELPRAFRAVPLPLHLVPARLYPLLNRIWSGHPGYVPLTLEEFTQSSQGLLAILSERYISIIQDPQGRDVGYGFMYPDYVDQVRAINGDARRWAEWIGRTRALRMVLHTVGVLPEVRRLGAIFDLIQSLLGVCLDEGFEEFVFALATPQMARLLSRFAPPTREYALYGRSLTMPV